MKSIIACLFGFLLVGCSSTRLATLPAESQNTGLVAATAAPVSYHHELLPESSEGTTLFLRLVPDAQP